MVEVEDVSWHYVEWSPVYLLSSPFLLSLRSLDFSITFISLILTN